MLFSVRKFVYVSDESGSLEVFVVVSGKTWMEVSLIDGQTLADCWECSSNVDHNKLECFSRKSLEEAVVI